MGSYVGPGAAEYLVTALCGEEAKIRQIWRLEISVRHVTILLLDIVG